MIAEEQDFSARTMVRKGEVREEIKKAALEVDASLIVLGRPAGEESAFQLASLQAFATDIENRTGVKAVIV